QADLARSAAGGQAWRQAGAGRLSSARAAAPAALPVPAGAARARTFRPGPLAARTGAMAARARHPGADAQRDLLWRPIPEAGGHGLGRFALLKSRSWPSRFRRLAPLKSRNWSLRFRRFASV